MSKSSNSGARAALKSVNNAIRQGNAAEIIEVIQVKLFTWESYSYVSSQGVMHV